MTGRKKFQWGKLNGSGLRNQRVGLRAANPPAMQYERAGQKFYNTQEWKRLRAEIKKATPYCQACTVTSKQRRLIVDHIKEIKDGGDPYDRSNLQVLCYRCHGIKTNRERQGRG